MIQKKFNIEYSFKTVRTSNFNFRNGNEHTGILFYF